MRKRAPPFSEDPGAVRIIKIQECVSSSAEAIQFRDRRNISVHTEDRIRNNDPPATAALFHKLFEVGNIAMTVYDGLRIAQPAAVDDARMVMFVAEDDVLFRGKGRYHAGIGSISGIEHARRRHFFEPCDTPFKSFVKDRPSCEKP